jgi:hypothetical protein
MGVEMLAGLGLSLLGTGLGVGASVIDQNKMNDAASAELLRQQGYQKQANTAFQASAGQAGSDTAQKQIANTANQQSQLYKALQSSNLTGAPSSTASPDAVTQARTQAIIGQGNQAGSRLAGYGGWQTNQYLKDLQAQEQLGVIGGNARGSAAVLPYELQQAGHAGDSLAFAGQGLSALGSLGGLASIYGALPAIAGSMPSMAQSLALHRQAGMLPYEGDIYSNPLTGTMS